MPCSLPDAPTHRPDQHCRRSQCPRRNRHQAARNARLSPRAQLLPQAHLYARWRRMYARSFPQKPQIAFHLAPGLQQRAAMSADSRVCGGFGPFLRVSIAAVKIQAAQFEFFAIHHFNCLPYFAPALARRGASRKSSNFASSKALPRCRRERIVPIGQPHTWAASS